MGKIARIHSYVLVTLVLLTLSGCGGGGGGSAGEDTANQEQDVEISGRAW